LETRTSRSQNPDGLQTSRQCSISDPGHLGAGIEQTLKAHDADRVVLAFVDLLWDAHEWPPTGANVKATKARFASVLDQLQAVPKFVLPRDQYFATVALR
jgi:hypothetical protein